MSRSNLFKFVTCNPEYPQSRYACVHWLTVHISYSILFIPYYILFADIFRKLPQK